ncbi:MAG: type II toxin-antitoxin system RelB/DinJ family antitoxin [Candidatus Methanomethylophilaceae archaeon]|nr:type II toxin-antitoxin system RelB/DinJ family antitoxin [Candidatus Methanomethylophilaceae archaeon]
MKLARYEELGRAIEESVRKACEGKEVGIAFSGGMDSGILAALASKCARTVTCYTCGTDDSFDVAAGRELAEKLGLPWVHCRIGEDNIEGTIRDFMLATGVSDPFTVSYDLQLFAVCRNTVEPVIVSGQGSDEYFGGCARSVNEDDSEYRAVMDWGVERLMKVSVPCETSIARRFKKRLCYPYLDEEVVRQVGMLPPEALRPASLEDRKAVLKAVATDLGYPLLARRTKKASQYGSNTTELIRRMARRKGVRYNRYISDIYESLGLRNANYLRDSAVDVRLDPILVHDAEEVLERLGVTHSEAVAMFYRRMVREGGLGFLEEDLRDRPR